MKRSRPFREHEESRRRGRRPKLSEADGPQDKGIQPLHDQAAEHLLGTARFPTDALTSTWAEGDNRAIDWNHVKKLHELFTDHGLRRNDPECRIRIGCTKAQFESMVAHVESSARLSRDHETTTMHPWFGDWINVVGCKAELIAGSHRIEALEKLYKHSRDRWWTASIYNTATLPLPLKIRLRANRSNSTLVDSHAQVWRELVTLSRTGQESFLSSAQLAEDDLKRYLLLSESARFPVRRLCTLWRNQAWRSKITELCEFEIGRDLFNISTFELMASLRIDDFWFEALDEVMRQADAASKHGCNDISAYDWVKLASVPDGSRNEALRELFYPGWDAQQKSPRRRARGFLTKNSDHSYHELYKFLVAEPEARFNNIQALFKSVKPEWKKISAILSHVGYWLNVNVKPVHDRASNKPLLRLDFEPAFESTQMRAQSILLQAQIISYARDNLAQLSSEAAQEFLREYPKEDWRVYVTRFQNKIWHDLLILVRSFIGGGSEHKVLPQVKLSDVVKDKCSPNSSAVAQVVALVTQHRMMANDPGLCTEDASKDLHRILRDWKERHSRLKLGTSEVQQAASAYIESREQRAEGEGVSASSYQDENRSPSQSQLVEARTREVKSFHARSDHTLRAALSTQSEEEGIIEVTPPSAPTKPTPQHGQGSILVRRSESVSAPLNGNENDVVDHQKKHGAGTDKAAGWRRKPMASTRNM